jgi:hypothetical protein
MGAVTTPRPDATPTWMRPSGPVPGPLHAAPEPRQTDVFATVGVLPDSWASARRR